MTGNEHGDRVRRWAKVAAGFALGAALFLMLAVAGSGISTLTAQTPTPAFAAVSIRPYQRGGGLLSTNLVQTDPAGIRAVRQSLIQLIGFAYAVEDYQVGPRNRVTWATTYDVTATTSAPASKAQLRLMLRQVLKDRFGLTLVRHDEATPVYELVVAPGGPKFHMLGAHEIPGRSAIESGEIVHHFTTIHDLVYFLNFSQANGLRRPLIDDTGLRGRYDIPFAVGETPITVGGRRGWKLNLAETPSALKSLGLELKPARVPYLTYSIENAHAPTAN